jgi:hypothetical protein
VDILCYSPGIPCLKTRFPSPDLATNELKTRLNGGGLTTDTTTAKMTTIVITTSTQKNEFLNKKNQKLIQGIGLFQ